ncbi:MAG: SRPBCC domain-containing protein [Myxococcales bacterium]|nr:MAG: SRPBCC domain-containing protein [Myxococcales bacterium]
MPKTELRSEVEIDAPRSHVYRVLTDFAHYEEWNPYFTRVAGELVVGSTLQLELSLPEGSAYELAAEVTRVAPDEALRWVGRFWSSALLQLEQSFALTEPRAGVTRVLQGQDFSGFLLRFAGKGLTQAARGAVYMNQALKKRAESTR